MSKVIIDMAISLDGCIATREGEDDGLHPAKSTARSISSGRSRMGLAFFAGWNS